MLGGVHSEEDKITVNLPKNLTTDMTESATIQF